MSSTPNETSQRPPAQVPVDFAAILAAMQDQIDDLTSVVEAHERRLVELDAARKA
jgi:hypothetical protein